MKIITWNCNMAFRKKAALLLAHKPDIAVIPECEHPDKLHFAKEIPAPDDMAWFGENKNKGIGIFSYSGYRIKVLDEYNEQFKYIIPLHVRSKAIQFTLLAIWANNPADPDGQYVTQIWKAIHHYKNLLKRKRIILAGDFNSNSIWDKPRRKGNHTDVVAHLEKRGVESVYHHYFSQTQGMEKHPTFYLYKHKDKAYHLDYCFASATLMNSIRSVEIGSYDHWKQYSDHVPVIVTFDTV
ncbi:MAG: endonuclease/exonuclease/phosphatase family protein [Bacteroidetes bacterium]|nr:endonuclease/exonuclease/phosphatase family protein [Bacteroidota bacterium]